MNFAPSLFLCGSPASGDNLTAWLNTWLCPSRCTLYLLWYFYREPQRVRDDLAMIALGTKILCGTLLLLRLFCTYLYSIRFWLLPCTTTYLKAEVELWLKLLPTDHNNNDQWTREAICCFCRFIIKIQEEFQSKNKNRPAAEWLWRSWSWEVLNPSRSWVWK